MCFKRVDIKIKELMLFPAPSQNHKQHPALLLGISLVFTTNHEKCCQVRH